MARIYQNKVFILYNLSLSLSLSLYLSIYPESRTPHSDQYWVVVFQTQIIG